MKLLIILRVVFVAISGCFFFVGAALEGDLRPHHKSTFDFDEVLFTELNSSILSYSFFIHSREPYSSVPACSFEL